MSKVIPIGKIGDYITSELIIEDDYKMIIDYKPPYKKEALMKIKCKLCGDIIEGDKKGRLICCTCESCYIDETPYYARIGGDPENWEVVKDEK